MRMNSDLQSGIAVALIILAILSPIAYCSAHIEDRPNPRIALMEKCMEMRGRWVNEWFGTGYCAPPKESTHE